MESSALAFSSRFDARDRGRPDLLTRSLGSRTALLFSSSFDYFPAHTRSDQDRCRSILSAITRDYALPFYTYIAPYIVPTSSVHHTDIFFSASFTFAAGTDDHRD